jgi:hypothetical protein
VVGRGFCGVIPTSNGRLGDNKPSRLATYSEKVGIDISISTAAEFKDKKKQAVTTSSPKHGGLALRATA